MTEVPSGVQRRAPVGVWGTGGSRICQAGRIMASGSAHGERAGCAECKHKRGSGAEAQRCPRAELMVGGQGRRSPLPEAESFLYIFIQESGQKLRI